MKKTTYRIILFAICVGIVLDMVIFLLLKIGRLTWPDPLGNLLTIIAALIGGSFIIWQTNAAWRQQRIAEVTRRAAKLKARRATMPLALSGVVEFAIDTAKYLRTILNKSDVLAPRGVGEFGVPPLFPNDLVEDLSILVECAPLELGDDIARLLSLVQVIRARLRDVAAWVSPGPEPSWTVSSRNVEDYIIDVMELYARAGALFQYARFRSETSGKVQTSHLKSALNQLGFNTESNPRLYAKASSWTAAEQEFPSE